MKTPPFAWRSLSLGLATSVLLGAPAFAESHATSNDANSGEVMMPKVAGPDQVVAKVGGTEITIGHMIAMTSTLPQNQLQGPLDELFYGVLDRLIQQEAVASTVSNPSPMVMLQLENERRSLLASTVVNRIAAEIEVTPELVQAAYDRRFENFSPDMEFKASHILVETEEDATAIAQELATGADFGELAREKSTGPTGPNGGSLGWFAKGRMVPPFEAAVAALEKGQVSGPVQTEFGWHVILLEDTRIPTVPSLEQLQPELEQEVFRNLFDSAVGELLSAAPVERFSLENVDPSILLNPAALEN